MGCGMHVSGWPALCCRNCTSLRPDACWALLPWLPPTQGSRPCRQRAQVHQLNQLRHEQKPPCSLRAVLRKHRQHPLTLHAFVAASSPQAEPQPSVTNTLNLLPDQWRSPSVPSQVALQQGHGWQRLAVHPLVEGCGKRPAPHRQVLEQYRHRQQAVLAAARLAQRRLQLRQHLLSARAGESKRVPWELVRQEDAAKRLGGESAGAKPTRCVLEPAVLSHQAHPDPPSQAHICGLRLVLRKLLLLWRIVRHQAEARRPQGRRVAHLRF